MEGQRGPAAEGGDGERYELGPLLREDAGARVHRARDRELGRDVALFVSRSAAAEDVERLARVARSLARLEHPGLVPVHDAGRLADGRAFCATKLVEGRALGEHARAVPALAERVALLLRVCEPLAYAHGRGAAHGALRAESVQIGGFGEVLVGGFGAEALGRGEEPTIAGDVRALGELLRELLRGASEPAPRRLRAIAARASSEDEEERYASAAELAADLERYLEGEAVAAYRESTGERVRRFLSRHRVAVGLVAAYALLRVLTRAAFGI